VVVTVHARVTNSRRAVKWVDATPRL
jgi:hypothetical protein